MFRSSFRAHGRFVETLGVPGPLADTVALRGMDPDESSVLEAIRIATAGRFPSPERGPRLPSR